MANQKGFSTLIGIIISAVVILAVGGGGYYFAQKMGYIPNNRPSDILPPLVGGDKDAHGCIGSAGYSWCEVKNKCLRTWEEKCEADQNTETPAVESDVTNQPAFLIAAYSSNGKNYIDVDYVTWLHGDASITAQVADGKCANANDCQAYPNGYKQNLNPKIRTFEVPSSTPIIVNGEISSVVNNIDQTHLGDPYGKNLSISFNKLKTAISEIKSWLPAGPQFKTPKAFITISVKNNIVTNITEPYQE